MKISNGFKAISAYRGSKNQEEALVARTTESETEQVRIAENSKSRLVLLNLALNENLSAKAVKALYAGENEEVHERLQNLGYKKD